MIEIAFNPVTVLISFMTFLVYLYKENQLQNQRGSSNRRKAGIEQTPRNTSMEHGSNAQAEYYKSVQIPGENKQNSQNTPQGQNNMVLRTQTMNMGSGQGNFNPGSQSFNPPIRHQTSSNFGDGFQDFSNPNNAPLRRNLSTNPGNILLNSSNGGANFSSIQNISAADQKAFAAQAGGLPPLFIGFLTNDVSMKHVQFMVDTYNKAASNNKEKAKSILRQKLEKNSERQKGKFDARYLTSSDEEEDEISDQEEMKEEPKKLERAKEGHKGTKSLLKKRAEATKTETYQNVKLVQGKTFSKNEISTDVFKQNHVKLKTDSNTQEQNKIKASESFKDLNISKEKTEASFSGNNSKFSNSLFGNQQVEHSQAQIADKETKPKPSEQFGGFLAKAESKVTEKEEKEPDFGKRSPISKPLKEDAGNALGGLFGNSVKEVEKSQSDFTLTLKRADGVSAPVEDKGKPEPPKSLFGEKKDEPMAKQPGGLFSNFQRNESVTTDTEKPKEEVKTQVATSLFSNFGVEKKESQDSKPSGLFSNLSTNNLKEGADKQTEKKSEGAGLFGEKKTESGLFGGQTETGGLFSTIKPTEQKNPATAEPSQAPQTSLFSNLTNNTGGGLFSTNQTSGTQPSATSFFGDKIQTQNTIQEEKPVQTGSFFDKPSNSNAGGLFANTSSQNFMESSNQSPKPSGLFPQSNNDSNQNPFMILNSSQNKRSPGGGLDKVLEKGSISQFGNNNKPQSQQSNPLANLFGNGGSSNNPLLASNNTNQTPNNANPFAAAASKGDNGEMFSNMNGGQSGGIFGGQGNSSGGLFGNQNSSNGGLFGNNNSNTSGGLFGSIGNGNGTGLFGSN